MLIVKLEDYERLRQQFQEQADGHERMIGTAKEHLKEAKRQVKKAVKEDNVDNLLHWELKVDHWTRVLDYNRERYNTYSKIVKNYDRLIKKMQKNGIKQIVA